MRETLHATHLLKLLGKMYKYEMDPTRTVGTTKRTCDPGRTDRVKPIYPPTTSLCHNKYCGGLSSVDIICVYVVVPQGKMKYWCAIGWLGRKSWHWQTIHFVPLNTLWHAELCSVVLLYRGQISPKSSQQTPRSSPVRARYGVSVVSFKYDVSSVAVIAVPFVKL